MLESRLSKLMTLCVCRQIRVTCNMLHDIFYIHVTRVLKVNKCVYFNV